MSNRTSPRHPKFDYRAAAVYFVTVCTHERRCLFGTVRQGRMRLNEIGTIVADEWRRSEDMRDEVVLDAFVIMPNHLHGLVCLVPPGVEEVSPRGYDLSVGPNPLLNESASPVNVGTTGGSSLQSKEEKRPKGPVPRSISAIMAGFKSAATKRINRHRETPGAPVWQSRFYDRIVRNEREWRACRRYIEENPVRWTRDRHHPKRQ